MRGIVIAPPDTELVNMEHLTLIAKSVCAESNRSSILEYASEGNESKFVSDTSTFLAIGSAIGCTSGGSVGSAMSLDETALLSYLKLDGKKLK